MVEHWGNLLRGFTQRRCTNILHTRSDKEWEGPFLHLIQNGETITSYTSGAPGDGMGCFRGKKLELSEHEIHTRELMGDTNTKSESRFYYAFKNYN